MEVFHLLGISWVCCGARWGGQMKDLGMWRADSQNSPWPKCCRQRRRGCPPRWMLGGRCPWFSSACRAPLLPPRPAGSFWRRGPHSWARQCSERTTQSPDVTDFQIEMWPSQVQMCSNFAWTALTLRFKRLASLAFKIARNTWKWHFKSAGPWHFLRLGCRQKYILTSNDLSLCSSFWTISRTFNLPITKMSKTAFKP